MKITPGRYTSKLLLTFKQTNEYETVEKNQKQIMRLTRIKNQKLNLRTNQGKASIFRPQGSKKKLIQHNSPQHPVRPQGFKKKLIRHNSPQHPAQVSKSPQFHKMEYTLESLDI